MRLRVITPRLGADRTVAVCGSAPELGAWNPAAAPAMELRGGLPLHTLSLPDSLPADTEFKFIVRRGDEIRWEEGPNRTLACPGPIEFRGLNRWRAAGVAVPVFSLRSDDDFGCGDFADLRLLVDWAERTGMQVIQILPVNDTTMSRTRADSYPYNANSSFALNPLYLRPQLLGEIPDPALRAELEAERRRLNDLPDVDYPAVIAAKERYARSIYSERGGADIASRPFADFAGANAAWLLPYCAWSVLRDRHGSADFRSWGDDAVYSPGLVAEMLLDDTRRREMLFYAWLQFRLHGQLLDACRYARSRGVAVKGDIPIGISPDSADAWQHPELFNLDSCAGAPPDAFATDGQNWGFPTYNWPRMAADGFGWWRRRLAHMAEYFDAYRIDHVLGFFRIWEIPAGIASGLLGAFSPALPLSPAEMETEFGFRFAPGMALPASADTKNRLFVADRRRPGFYHPRIEGYKTDAFAALDPAQQQAYARLHEDFFYRRHNDFWQRSAESKLPALTDATPMLACAEDLGMIPACVPLVLEAERILALEVQRMPKQYGVSIADPAAYGYMNVATTSTHDMPPLRLWRLQTDGVEPAIGELRDTLRAHMTSPAMLAVLPLQDWLAISPELRRHDPAEEQINVPADPAHYWRYRMHLSLETLRAANAFNAEIAALTALRR